MKKLILFSLLSMVVWACGNSGDKSTSKKEEVKKETPAADDGKGIGEVKNVVLNNPLNEEMISEGKGIYELKCAACHKLTATRIVGPGFKGVTEKRKPEWIMNMITNVEIMLDEDPEARKLFEECLTRMPNQNLTIEEARSVVEFLFHNDAAE